MLCCGYTLTDFPISIRLTSLALWQSNDCSSASKATLMNMDKYFMWIHYEWLHNYKKAKHNKTVCIFLDILYVWMWNSYFENKTRWEALMFALWQNEPLIQITILCFLRSIKNLINCVSQKQHKMSPGLKRKYHYDKVLFNAENICINWYRAVNQHRGYILLISCKYAVEFSNKKALRPRLWQMEIRRT